MSYPVPENESARLKALQDYHILDTSPEETFDRLARLASRLFNVPIVLVSLLARDRQFFKARVGIDVCGTSREVSFCAHAIMQDEIFLVPDAAKDRRFASNPLVLGPPFIRFYAGKPLVAAGGEKIGTLCLIDTRPRAAFGANDRRYLEEIAALVMDRIEMRRLEHARSACQARFENIAHSSPDAIMCSDASGSITFWNRAAERLFGYVCEDIVGKPATAILAGKSLLTYAAETARLRNGQNIPFTERPIELTCVEKGGAEFLAEVSLSTWNEGDNAIAGLVIRDVTEHRQNEERLFKLASLDTLTDLPHRGIWKECLKQYLDTDRPVTLFLVDMDGFKEINDRLGHLAGDVVLKEVANRLRLTCKDAIMVARLAGDEFVALHPGDDSRQARAVASQLLAAFSTPIEFERRNLEIGASVGVALAPLHASASDELMTAADLALHRAKAAGKGRYELFTPALRDVAIARRNLEDELRRAFHDGEFELFYQPQFATADRRLTGAEALIRWHHSERGLLTPASFIDVLGSKPSAPEVGEWILRTACRQAAQWRASVPDFRMGVNLFAEQFRSRRLLTVVKEAMAENRLPGQAIELEIVENILLRNDSATLSRLHELRELGVGLAFDDYGTGYASLSLLKRYPVSRLKIDRSFIRNVNLDSENEAIVRAILDLGRSFRMEVIAEGVETEAQLDFLARQNCPEVQGYLLGRPLPANEFQAAFVVPLAA